MNRSASNCCAACRTGARGWIRPRASTFTAATGSRSGDIDGDGADEVYVCQPGGLPNRLYKMRGGQFEDITDARGRGAAGRHFMRAVSRPAEFRRAGPGGAAGGGSAAIPESGRRDVRAAHGRVSFRRQAAGELHGNVGGGLRSRRPHRSVPVHVHLLPERGSVSLSGAVPRCAERAAEFSISQPAGGGRVGDVRGRDGGSGINDNNNRFSFAPAWCDYDGDGWPDLYVANDFGRHNLYRNREGQFRDVARARRAWRISDRA